MEDDYRRKLMVEVELGKVIIFLFCRFLQIIVFVYIYFDLSTCAINGVQILIIWIGALFFT